MANKTAEEILRTQFEVEDDPSCQREHFDEDVKRASRQLYEAELQRIGEDEDLVKPVGDNDFESAVTNAYRSQRNAIRADLRAKARAFYGITETEQEGSAE